MSTISRIEFSLQLMKDHENGTSFTFNNTQKFLQRCVPFSEAVVVMWWCGAIRGGYILCWYKLSPLSAMVNDETPPC